MIFKKARFLLMPLIFVTSLCIGPARAVDSRNLPAASNDPIETVTVRSGRRESRVATGSPAATSPAAGLPVRAPHEGAVTDLFAGHSWYQAPPPPPVRQRIEPAARRPTAPPLPYSYIGTLAQDGADTLYFLVKGDRVYDVKVGDVLDGAYKVDKVSKGQLIFVYLPLNTSQGLRLGESK